jgi:hypothetical protein
VLEADQGRAAACAWKILRLLGAALLCATSSSLGVQAANGSKRCIAVGCELLATDS